MSSLSVYHVSSPELPNKVLTHFEDIVSTLAEQGVVFDRLPTTTPIRPGASQDEVVQACREPIDRLMSEHGCASLDVVSVSSEHPQKAELRARFLDEHRHGADEMRLFVAGRGLVSLHIGDYLYAVLCERSDLLSVPAGMAQWFDMGEHPHLVAIRMFGNAQGMVAHPTGADIASHFPGLDD
ncbi:MULTISPECIES: acireductone dioxygenase [unclassified Pseudomonas]|uniref:1,2-dihydroxy-3-keto-5-methylthiopentene dioxygenase n=1 Tax=unclassified Pseudomonas TaxID=196821 RepID=UPI001C5B0B3E|nr:MULTISPECIES: acireductone dioxygenase [unclassified Pseudomonas]MBW3503191.1 acireductone dioxygenase [Pseudomonas sp. NKUCC02_KPG]MEC4240274.1 acireductone dioxygenase [Pseudomonas sp. DSV-1]